MTSFPRNLILVGLVLATPSLLAAQHTDCPSVAYSNIVANPITGDLRGTEINLTTGQSSCVALVKVAEGRFGPTKVGQPVLTADSLKIKLSDGSTFLGKIVGDTLHGRFDQADAKPLVLPRTSGALHVHEH